MQPLDYRLKFAPPEIWEDNRWTVLTFLMLHANVRNRCWPSVRTIAARMHKSTATINKAKQWLIKAGAIKIVPIKERSEEEKALSRRLHIYQLTGEFLIEGKKYPYFYLPPETDTSETDDDPDTEDENVAESKILENATKGNLGIGNDLESGNGIESSNPTLPLAAAEPQSEPEKPIPAPSQTFAPLLRQPTVSAKLPPVSGAYSSKSAIDTKPLTTAAAKTLVPSKSGNGTVESTSAAAASEQEPKRDLIFEWVCSSVLHVSLDDVRANHHLRGRVNTLTSMIVHSAQIRSKAGEKLTLAEKNELAAKLPKMIPFYQKLKPGCEFPTGNGTFGALVSQWFEAGCRGGIEPPKTYVDLDYDPNCPLGCKEGTLYFTDEKGDKTTTYCPCMRERYKKNHGVDLK